MQSSSRSPSPSPSPCPATAAASAARTEEEEQRVGSTVAATMRGTWWAHEQEAAQQEREIAEVLNTENHPDAERLVRETHVHDGITTRVLPVHVCQNPSGYMHAELSIPSNVVSAETFAAFVRAALRVLTSPTMKRRWVAEAELEESHGCIRARRHGAAVPFSWGRSLSMPLDNGVEERTVACHEFAMSLHLTMRGTLFLDVTLTGGSYDEEWGKLFDDFMDGMVREGYVRAPPSPALLRYFADRHAKRLAELPPLPIVSSDLLAQYRDA